MKKKLYITLLFCSLLLTSCGKNSKTINEKYADYKLTCPQVIVQSGIKFGLTKNPPTLKDLVQDEFYNENYSIKEIKKKGNEYYVSYCILENDKEIAIFIIGYLINDDEKTISFNHLKVIVKGKKKVDIKCPELKLTEKGKKDLGYFYGAVDEVFKMIFDIDKLNEAIN